MLEIRSSLAEFRQALFQESIVCDSRGRWKKIPRWMHRAVRVMRQENRRVAGIGRAFSASLDQLERVPVPAQASKRAEFVNYLVAGEEVKKLLKGRSSSTVKRELNKLQSRLSALSIRLWKEEALDPSDETLQKTKDLLAAWKENKICFAGSEAVSSEEEDKLFQACRYASFAKRILKDSLLQERFFTWAIRDKNGVEPFIQYPSICEKLMAGNLSSRTGFYESQGDGLAIELRSCLEGKEKVLTLPFEGIRVSILDEQNGLWSLPLDFCAALKGEK